ncbi:MAG: LytR/AlgR family response regulator transcription factor [Bacteroides sp.]
MEKYSVAVVEDDVMSLANLCELLAGDKRFQLVGAFMTGAEAYKALPQLKPQLLFLDVELPDITGMSLLHELRKLDSWGMKVVFYTAYDKYMIHAIREAAFDYLLKPFLPVDLNEILERFVAEYTPSDSKPEIPQPRQPAGPVEGPKLFMVYSSQNEMLVLRSSEVGYFHYSSERKVWEVTSTLHPILQMRRGLTAEQIVKLSPNFVQVHQSYIINMDFLMLIKENSCQFYPPFNTEEVLISKKFKREVQERFAI